MNKAALAFAAAVVAACATAPPAVRAAENLPGYDHVVVVVEENHTAESIIGNPAAPFINALAAGGALMTESFAVAHPSQPNYLALFAGDTFGVDSDVCPLNLGGAPNLASELIAAGRSFGGFAEGLPASAPDACRAGAYARKHAPWANFTNVPADVAKPIDAFSTGALPAVSFVIPDLKDDMHDGSVAAADNWLAARLAGYADWAKANNSLLIVTWDEDDTSGDNRIPTIFYGAGVKPGSYSQRIDHYSVVSTVRQIFGLPAFGRPAAPVDGIWTG